MNALGIIFLFFILCYVGYILMTAVIRDGIREGVKDSTDKLIMRLDDLQNVLEEIKENQKQQI